MMRALLLAALLLQVGACKSRVPDAPLHFMEDDYTGALESARTRQVPLFVDAWAPW